MNRVPQRGEIWLVDWSPGRGSEQAGLRPALIVQTDAANLNPNYPNTIVLTISTKGKPVPFHIYVDPSGENKLKTKSYVKCEQILTIAKERLAKRIGVLEISHMQQIKEAIKTVLEID